MNHLRIFIFIFLSLIHQSFSLEYGIDAKSNDHSTITDFAIFGERCSGTNFLREIVLQNLTNNDQPLQLTRKYGHKHWPRWFNQPLEFYNGPRKKYTFEDNTQVLFLVIFRNPYDWLRSLKKHPYGAAREIKWSSFSNFIRCEWKLNTKKEKLKNHFFENPYLDRNPEDGSFFDNVIKLRIAKIRTMLEIKDRVDNIYFINYETLRDNPEQVLDEIAALFHLERTEEYYPIVYHKGRENQGEFKQKKYSNISAADLEFINSQLDENLENEIGYSLVTNPQKIN